MIPFFKEVFLWLTDPTFTVSLWGAVLACVSLSWIGVIYSLRRSALIGEVIAHSAFPGLILGAFIGIIFDVSSERMNLLLIIGAIATAYLSMKKLTFLQTQWKKSPDAALMISISSFLGMGVLLASILQSVDPVLYKNVMIFLYGRTATMLAFHVKLYAIVMILLSFFLITFHRRIKMFEFDKTFAGFFGIGKGLERAIVCVTLVVIIISLRSCGILLLAGMMTTPAIAARWWVKKISSIFFLSTFFGAFSALLGSFLSIYIGGDLFVLPTGPMITTVSAACTLFSLLFGKRGGLIVRMYRRILFSLKCQEENLLKSLYKKGGAMKIFEVKEVLNSGALILLLVIFRARDHIKISTEYTVVLKEAGVIYAERVVRLHRLWEVYLCEVGFMKHRVHAFADEIEHVLTEEMENILVKRLKNPTHCPHQQKIPKKLEEKDVPV